MRLTILLAAKIQNDRLVHGSWLLVTALTSSHVRVGDRRYSKRDKGTSLRGDVPMIRDFRKREDFLPRFRTLALLLIHGDRMYRQHAQQTYPKLLKASQDNSRILHGGFDLPQEHHGLASVDQPMIVRQSHIHHWSNYNLGIQTFDGD